MVDEARLENPSQLRDALEDIGRRLVRASRLATYSEGDRTGLHGSLTTLIGGLADVVGSLADALEESAGGRL